MQLTFKQRTALITGAGRGIGKAIAKALARENIKVICVSKSSSCEATAQEIQNEGGNAQAYPVDVANAQSVDEVCLKILDENEQVDILVNNAGITRDGLLLRMSNEDWDSVIQTNLSSVFYWIKGLLRPMTKQRWGRIINISSVSGIMGNPGQFNYCAAKAGMIGATKSLAKEVASRNVTANVVAPGFIETDMTSELLSGKMQEGILNAIPLKRVGKAEDIASMVTYLASEEAGYITGKVFSIDGGMVM